jgi:ectoine hydroxylase-related dioxygenase (phytanoyl-CoA dioxygenase family)
MTGRMSSPERQAYEQAGYYVAKGLMPVGRVDDCLSDLNAIFNGQLQARAIADAGSLFERAHALFCADLAQYKKVLASLWRLHSVGNLFAQPCMTAFLKEVFGFGTVFMPGGQSVHLQSHELKIPDGYFGLEPHQDWPSVQGSLDGLVAWIPLCKVEADSFPLEIVPGSHRRGLRGPHDGNTADKWVVREYADSAFVPIDVEPGDVVFFSNFTVHRSGLAGPARHMRIACSSRYDNGSEPTFIERAYPTAYTRGVHRPLLDFDGVDAVNAALAGLSPGRA